MTAANFHGDPARFPALVDLVVESFGSQIRFIADVAGGQGMLSRLLRKHNYESEVIDPRGWRLRGVPGEETTFDPSRADYYDLVIGLHPDEATQAVVLSALKVPTVLVPCCNYWDGSERLGTNALLDSIEAFYDKHGVQHHRQELDLQTPKRWALVTRPPAQKVDLATITLPSLERARDEGEARSKWISSKKKR